MVLVGHDGVQYPPLCFPKGSHLLQFLTCLETSLLPDGQLDPPLWSEEGKGKVFPKLNRKSARISKSSPKKTEPETSPGANTSNTSDYDKSFDHDLSEQNDYVFRIIRHDKNGKVKKKKIKFKNLN